LSDGPAIKQQPDVMINLSASPFDYIHDEERKSVIKSNVIKYKLPIFYCNAVGSQTEIVFDGVHLYLTKWATMQVATDVYEAVDALT
jgi:NAD+ synthase (glutamine-hydrolysing)